MGSAIGKILRKSKLCSTCDKQVKANREQRAWGMGDLFMLAFTAGLWLPLRLTYEAGANPWRCDECDSRIEPWPQAMGKAAGYGFGGLALVFVVLPGLIDISEKRQQDAEAERAAEAIVIETNRKAKLESEFMANEDQILADMESAIIARKYSAAKNLAKPYLFTRNAKLLALYRKALRKKSESELLRVAKTIPASELGKNAEIYENLAKLDPKNPVYRKKHQHYSAKLAAVRKREAARVAAAEKKAAADKAKRDAVIAKFGPSPAPNVWSSGYSVVEKYLKRIANDPESIAFDNCTKVYRTDEGWLVGCDYRGRNGFGGMVRQSNWFTIRHLQVVAMHDADKYRR